jgi:hypothetical protein
MPTFVCSYAYDIACGIPTILVVNKTGSIRME